MNKSKIISISLLILVALFATGCIKKPQTDQAQTKTSDSTTQKSDDDVDSFTGNLMDVLKMGKAVKCTGTYTGEEGSMDMTVYASGEKSYSEMTFDLGEEGTMESYSIYDGDWMYSWNNMGMASKMKVSDMEELAGDMPEAEDYEGADAETPQAFQQDFNYKCRPWIADNSKFTPPSDIEFVDLTQTMKDFTEAMESGNMQDLMDSGCSACDMIPDAAEKAECKANLSCE